MGNGSSKIVGDKVELPDIQPFIHSYAEFGNFETPETIDELSREKNYGSLFPENVYRKIMTYLHPREYINLILTCKLVHKIGSNPRFWREYYHSHFKIENQDYQSLNAPNFKKLFFKRFYRKSEYCYGRYKYFPVKPTKEDISFIRPRRSVKLESFKIAIIGDKGIGKRRYFEFLMKSCGARSSSFNEEDEIFFVNVETKRICHVTILVMDTKNVGDYNWVDVGLILCFDVSNPLTFENLDKLLQKHKQLRNVCSNNFVAPIFVGLNSRNQQQEISLESKVKKFIREHNSTNNGKFHAYIEVIMNEVDKDDKKKKSYSFENGFLPVFTLLDSIKKIEGKGNARYISSKKGRLRNIDLLLYENEHIPFVTDYKDFSLNPKHPYVILNRLVSESYDDVWKSHFCTNIEIEPKEEFLRRFGAARIDYSIFSIKPNLLHFTHSISKRSEDSTPQCGSYGSSHYYAIYNKRKVMWECRMHIDDILMDYEKFVEFENEVLLCQTIVHPRIIQYVGCLLDSGYMGNLFGVDQIKICNKENNDGELSIFLKKSMNIKIKTYDEYKGLKIKHQIRYKYGDDVEEEEEEWPVTFPVSNKLEICSQIIDGMVYLHSLNVVHPDLRLENILVGQDLNIRIQNYEKKKSIEEFSKRNYVPQELIRIRKMDKKCNVFSFALLVFTLFTGNFHPFPFQDKPFEQNVQERISNDPDFRPKMEELKESLEDHEDTADFLLKVLIKAWEHDPDKRIGFSDLHSMFLKRRK